MARDHRSDYHVGIVIFHLLGNPRGHHGLFSCVRNSLNEHVPTLIHPAILPTSMIAKKIHYHIQPRINSNSGTFLR